MTQAPPPGYDLASVLGIVACFFGAVILLVGFVLVVVVQIRRKLRCGRHFTMLDTNTHHVCHLRKGHEGLCVESVDWRGYYKVPKVKKDAEK